MSEKYQEKERRLTKWFEEKRKKDICLAFSGGVDSSVLLALAAKTEGEGKIYAVTFDTVLHPRCDAAFARQAAAQYGAEHHVLYVDELKNEAIRKNPKNRCYLCKRELFERLLAFAGARDVECVIEGTNADDKKQYRPGLLAVQELGIESPLLRFGITKDEVRKMAAEWGVLAADRPSTPCLATRLPYGTEIIPEVLLALEKGEAFLRELGLYNVRLRLHGEVLRIETDQKSFGELLACRDHIITYLKGLGFGYLALDLEGFRSGSMDEPSSAISRRFSF